jgi:hypothetical protein
MQGPHDPGDEPPGPRIARVLDALRGGHSHFPADRAAADDVDRQFPGARKALSWEVEFTRRVARWAAQRGIRQLVHAGAASYLPGRNLHDAAPSARVVYVNRVRDLHDDAAALLGTLPRCSAARDPGTGLLAIPEVAAMAGEGKVAVVFSLVLSYLPDAEAAALIGSLADGLPAGSAVALSLLLPFPGPGGDEVTAAALNAGDRLERRTRETVAGWMAGMDLTAGVTDVRLVPGHASSRIVLPATARAEIVGAVALVRLADQPQRLAVRALAVVPAVKACPVVGHGLRGYRRDHHPPPQQGLQDLFSRAHAPRHLAQGNRVLACPRDRGEDLGEGLAVVRQCPELLGPAVVVIVAGASLRRDGMATAHKAVPPPPRLAARGYSSRPGPAAVPAPSPRAVPGGPKCPVIRP